MATKTGQRRLEQAGFTVIEMLCAAVIVALLITAISPSVGNFTVKAKMASTRMNCRIVQSVVIGYATDHNGTLPTSRAQYVSSPLYKQLINPFNTEQKGIGSWGSSLGVSTEDNSHSQAPIAIWNVDPDSVALGDIAGVVLYVPYRTRDEAQAGTNSLPLGGDDGSATSYSVYTIEGMAILNLANPLSVPYSDSRITSW